MNSQQTMIDVLDNINNSSLDDKILVFKNLLKDITSLNDKKRALWIDIYTNSLIDRQNAYVNYQQICSICSDKSSEWAVHGRTVTATLERMQKTTEQLLKLADLIEQAQAKDDKDKPISKDDIFSKIAGKN